MCFRAEELRLVLFIKSSFKSFLSRGNYRVSYTVVPTLKSVDEILWCDHLSSSTSVKPRANGPNIVGQQLPTLLDVTCCVRLHTLLHVVACCCVKFETGQNFQPTTPNISLFHDRRSVAQQCWIRLRSSSNIVGATHTHYTWFTKTYVCCILPTMHCRSQACCFIKRKDLQRILRLKGSIGFICVNWTDKTL